MQNFRKYFPCWLKIKQGITQNSLPASDETKKEETGYNGTMN